MNSPDSSGSRITLISYLMVRGHLSDSGVSDGAGSLMTGVLCGVSYGVWGSNDGGRVQGLLRCVVSNGGVCVRGFSWCVWSLMVGVWCGGSHQMRLRVGP